MSASLLLLLLLLMAAPEALGQMRAVPMRVVRMRRVQERMRLVPMQGAMVRASVPMRPVAMRVLRVQPLTPLVR